MESMMQLIFVGIAIIAVIASKKSKQMQKNQQRAKQANAAVQAKRQSQPTPTVLQQGVNTQRQNVNAMRQSTAERRQSTAERRQSNTERKAEAKERRQDGQKRREEFHKGHEEFHEKHEAQAQKRQAEMDAPREVQALRETTRQSTKAAPVAKKELGDLPMGVATSDEMKKLEDLMICGYQPKLSFERDFLAEATDLLNRYTM